MKRFIPSRIEVAIFVTMAVLCTAAVGRLNTSSHDIGLSVLAIPMFLVAAVLGLRRSPAWTAGSEVTESQPIANPDEMDLA